MQWASWSWLTQNDACPRESILILFISGTLLRPLEKRGGENTNIFLWPAALFLSKSKHYKSNTANVTRPGNTTPSLKPCREHMTLYSSLNWTIKAISFWPHTKPPPPPPPPLAKRVRSWATPTWSTLCVCVCVCVCVYQHIPAATLPSVQ